MTVIRYIGDTQRKWFGSQYTETQALHLASIHTVTQYFRHGHVLLDSYVSNRGESEYTHEEAAERVDQRYGHGVEEYTVMEFVVTGKADHRTEGNAHGIEDLSCCVHPDLKKNVWIVKTMI